MAENLKVNDKIIQPESWFERYNSYDDVVLSTRVRLIRNLSDFLFVKKMSEDDKERVKSLIYDCFSYLTNYDFINYGDLSQTGIELLRDKNILTATPCSAVILNTDDESISCIINETEHLKMASFVSGLDCEQAMKKVYKLDEYLQTKLQFAATADFGYLTSRIKDCGSGMKITLRVFIPSIVLSGQIDLVNSLLKKNKYCIKPVFDLNGDVKFSNCIFDIYFGNSIEGTELEQMANMQSVGIQIIKAERKIRKDFLKDNPTLALNFFRQDFAKAVYSMLLDYEDSVSIISAVKWGLNIGFISGISDEELNALYFRIKSGHLKYLCSNFDFTFEDDIKNSVKLKVKRLRAIVIQQAFEGIVNENYIS